MQLYLLFNDGPDVKEWRNLARILTFADVINGIVKLFTTIGNRLDENNRKSRPDVISIVNTTFTLHKHVNIIETN